jgi:hypothetical protein
MDCINRVDHALVGYQYGSARVICKVGIKMDCINWVAYALVGY